jgi:hypothetical protein
MNKIIQNHFFLCDFFVHLFTSPKIPIEAREEDFYRRLLQSRPSKHRLKVFLCGKQLGIESHDQHFDKRKLLKKLLYSRMGCDTFLGEDIEDFKSPPTIDSDYLTIETREATASDLIFLFLESFGTTAELAAFVQNKLVINKLVVFNEIKFKEEERNSFLTLGPLKLLSTIKPGSVIYYNPSLLRSNVISDELISHFDKWISEKWFERAMDLKLLSQSWNFSKFAILATIHAMYPITEEKLNIYLNNKFSKEQINDTVNVLVKERKIKKREHLFFIPQSDLEKLGFNPIIIEAISMSRISWMKRRLADVDVENHYRVIL